MKNEQTMNRLEKAEAQLKQNGVNCGICNVHHKTYLIVNINNTAITVHEDHIDVLAEEYEKNNERKFTYLVEIHGNLEYLLMTERQFETYRENKYGDLSEMQFSVVSKELFVDPRENQKPVSKKIKIYNRTAPKKYDYWFALHSRGVNFPIGTHVKILKKACESRGIEVTAQ